MKKLVVCLCALVMAVAVCGGKPDPEEVALKKKFDAAKAQFKEPPADKMVKEGRLIIEKARWGRPAQIGMRGEVRTPERSEDVTERLRFLSTGDSLVIPIDEDTLQSDPCPHQNKRLTVLYTFDGDKRRNDSYSGEVLRIGAGRDYAKEDAQPEIKPEKPVLYRNATPEELGWGKNKTKWQK